MSHGAASQPQPLDCNHHVVVPGKKAKALNSAAVLATVVGAVGDDGSLREYWWDVTPDIVPIAKTDSDNDRRTVMWTIQGRLIDGADDLPGFGFDHAKGVVIDDPDWNTTWPQPVRQGDTWVLVVGHATTRRAYKYTLHFQVNGSTYTIDPELELGED